MIPRPDLWDMLLAGAIAGALVGLLLGLVVGSSLAALWWEQFKQRRARRKEAR